MCFTRYVLKKKYYKYFIGGLIAMNVLICGFNCAKRLF